MNAIHFSEPLRWGALDLPLFGLNRDWHGENVDPPAAWSLAIDPARLWFVAARSAPAKLHPQARPGRFLAELWKFDVAELFLADASSGRYWELNLAPNGAWWAAGFSAPRQPSGEACPDSVETFAELSPDGGWVAGITLPLPWLEKHLDLGPSTTANVAFILESPQQRFLSAANLGGGDPDFHRPAAFPPLKIVDSGQLPPQDDEPRAGS